jgi:hypothetical protein
MEKESFKERGYGPNKVRKKCKKLKEQTPDLSSTVCSSLWFIL